MPISISVVVPAYNSAAHLSRCLRSLQASDELPLEIIVVDDGSTDETGSVAAKYSAKLLASGGRRGPAFARNLGARAAAGDVLLFIDADVSVHTDTLSQIRAAFEADPELDALMGSYDSEPTSPDFLSQYRNLMHAYVHQRASRRASTFWSGCGAIRRKLFLEHSGFSEQFGRPSIEDIELGYRLNMAGCKIALDRDIQVSHGKRWTFWNLVKTDIFDRGIPWTELILRDWFMPDDLNVQLSQRVSVALAFLLAAFSGITAIALGGYFLIPLFTVLFILMGRWWSELAIAGRPRAASVSLIATLAAIVALAYRQHMFGLIPPLMLSPALLVVRHRYAIHGTAPVVVRLVILAYTVLSVVAALRYLPGHPLVLICLGILVLLSIMNSQFYLFLAGKKGIPFMLAAIPFHLLYHFYNGFSFIAGLSHHLLTGSAVRVREEPGTARDAQRHGS